MRPRKRARNPPPCPDVFPNREVPSINAASNASPESLNEENSADVRRLSSTPIPWSAMTISSPYGEVENPTMPDLEALLWS